MVGNPPWERVKLQEQEFFAERAPEIAAAKNAAARKKAIAVLPTSNPVLGREWTAAQRQAEAESTYLRLSGRFPLCGRGDLNTYSVFAETMRDFIAPRGRSGVITPTGLATDATTSVFFADTLAGSRLLAFVDFENEAKIFAGVDHRVRFAISTFTGLAGGVENVAFAFLVRHVEDVPGRVFQLAPQEVLLINPNTGTLPTFRTRADADVTLGIYRRQPHPLARREHRKEPMGTRFRDLVPYGQRLRVVPHARGPGGARRILRWLGVVRT